MKSPGRMTLFEVVELCDDLTQIRTDCLQTMAKQTPELDTSVYSEYWLVQRAHKLKGDSLSVARVLKLKAKWRDWTWKDGVNIHTVQGFLCSELIQAI